MHFLFANTVLPSELLACSKETGRRSVNEMESGWSIWLNTERTSSTSPRDNEAFKAKLLVTTFGSIPFERRFFSLIIFGIFCGRARLLWRSLRQLTRCTKSEDYYPASFRSEINHPCGGRRGTKGIAEIHLETVSGFNQASSNIVVAPPRALA